MALLYDHMTDKQTATGLTTKDTAMQKTQHVYSSLSVLQFLKCRSGVPVRSGSTTPLLQELGMELLNL